MEALHVENAPQLADALGMTKRNQERTVRRWVDDQNAPSYEATLKLLTAVGLLPAKRPADLFATPGAAARAVVAAQELEEAQRRLQAARESPPGRQEQTG